jgi:hypothetical protein
MKNGGTMKITSLIISSLLTGCVCGKDDNIIVEYESDEDVTWTILESVLE